MAPTAKPLQPAPQRRIGMTHDGLPPSQRPLVIRLRAAEAHLDDDPTHAFALMLDVYADAQGTTDHDVSDGIELAVQVYASAWLLALIEARQEAHRDVPRTRGFAALAQIVRDALTRLAP